MFFGVPSILKTVAANHYFASKGRSSRPEVFCKNGALRNFAKFTLLKKRLWHRFFPVHFCEISKNIFSYRTPLVASSVKVFQSNTTFFYPVSEKLQASAKKSSSFTHFHANQWFRLMGFKPKGNSRISKGLPAFASTYDVISQYE